MIITRRAIPRRTLLRGAGASLALPLLDGMVPAATAQRLTSASPVKRLCAIYVPNGMEMARWTPATAGTDLALTPILAQLAPFREQMLLFTGYSNPEADPRDEGAGDHSRAQAVFLTGTRPKKTEGVDIRAGVSMDQVVAAETGKHTQLTSLEVALEANELVGTCDVGYSCAYSGTIAWRDATTPLPMEVNPRAVFERLFGDSDTTDRRARLERISEMRSILDSVGEDLARFKRGLGARDRLKISEYLDSVRDAERRIQRAEEQSARELPVVAQPSGVPPAFEDHATLMADLVTLAFVADLTRVATFMIGREISVRTYPEVGVAEPHHPVSHHQHRPEQLDKLAKINVFHVRILAHFLHNLRKAADGDGSLLDHSIVLYGAGMSDSNTHRHNDLPILLAGGGAGSVRGGRHVHVPADTPLSNLHLALTAAMDVPIGRLGDSTGVAPSLSAL